MPRSPSRGSNGRVAFAGPLGGSDDAVSNRILSDLDNEGCRLRRASVRVDGARHRSRSILLDATGEKTIATRRGVNLGRRPAEGCCGAGCRCRRRSRGQPFPGIRDRRVPRRPRREDSDRDRSRPGNDVDRSFARTRHPRRVASTEALFGTTGIKRLRSGPEETRRRIFPAFSPSPTVRMAFTGSKAARLRHLPAFKVEVIDSLGRGRCLPRRFHAGAGRRPRTSRYHALCQRHRRAQMHKIRRRLRRADPR